MISKFQPSMSTWRFGGWTERFQPIISTWSPTEQINQCEVVRLAIQALRYSQKPAGDPPMILLSAASMLLLPLATATAGLQGIWWIEPCWEVGCNGLWHAWFGWLVYVIDLIVCVAGCVFCVLLASSLAPSRTPTTHQRTAVLKVVLCVLL
jgi:hypothetical protein